MMELYEGLKLLIELLVKGEENIITKEPITTLRYEDVVIIKRIEEEIGEDSRDEEISEKVEEIKGIIDRDLAPLLPGYERELLLIKYLVSTEPVLVGMEELEFLERYLSNLGVRNIDHYLNVVLYDKVIKIMDRDHARRETVREYMEKQLLEERREHERYINGCEGERSVETRAVDDVYMSQEDNKRIVSSYIKAKADYHSHPLFQEMLNEYPDSLTREMVLWHSIPIKGGGNGEERYYKSMEEYADWDNEEGEIEKYGGMDSEGDFMCPSYSPRWCVRIQAPLKKEYREYVLKYQRKLYELESTDVFERANDAYERYKYVDSKRPSIRILEKQEALKSEFVRRLTIPSEIDKELGELYQHSKRRIEEIDEDMGRLKEMYKDNNSPLDIYNKVSRFDYIDGVRVSIHRIQVLKRARSYTITGFGILSFSLVSLGIYTIIKGNPIAKGMIVERLEDNSTIRNSVIAMMIITFIKIVSKSGNMTLKQIPLKSTHATPKAT